MKFSEIFESLAEIVWLDQFAHFLIGFVLVLTALPFMQWWLGVLVSLFVASVREMFQHPKECRSGCRTDLAFWIAGSLAVPLVLVVASLS